MTETVKEAARRLLASKIGMGYQPKMLHEYVNQDGQPIFWRARLEHPDGDAAPEGRKIIRPLHLNGHGFQLGEPDFGGAKQPLYNLDRITADESKVIYVVEGEKAADALTKFGVVATTSGGARSVDKADWGVLRNRSCILWPDNDDAGRAYMGDVASKLSLIGCTLKAIDVDQLALPHKGDAWDWVATHPDATADDVARLQVLEPHVDSSAASTPPVGPQAVVRRLSDVEAKPINWLWPGRIARGKVSMIAGHPGLGKSQLTAALAAVVTTGGNWPVDRTHCERGSVILLNAEDDAADTIRPRLEAAGADIERCEILDAVADGYEADGRPSHRGFSLKTDLRVLDNLLASRRDVAMVVVDPVTAYLSGVDSHVNADVRAIFAPLGELAAKHGVAIVCVSHLNKGGPAKGGAGEALLRVSGSLAFVAAARAAFIVVRDQENPARRLFLPAKNNVGKDETGLAFSVDTHVLPSGIETSRVMWEAAPVAISADEAMAAPPDEDERSMTDEAVEFLREAVSTGRVSAAELKRMGRDQGLSEKALRNARLNLGLEVVREGFGSDLKSYWRFPAGTFDNRPFVPSDPSFAHTCHRAQMDPEGTNGDREGGHA